MSAPPLAVRESGTPPTVTDSSPTRPPTTMPRPTKTTSVSLEGRSMYPSALPGALDVARGPGERQQVAAVE